MPITIENLTHSYMPGSKMEYTAIKDITLTINEREVFGIIGHTGSGKSTLIQHINGLLKPTSGKIAVNGIDLSENYASLKEVRKLVGLVFQYPEYQLFEETVWKDIAFGLKNQGIEQEDLDAYVREAMDLVELDYGEIKDKSPFELSGGQKRRVAIAGVIAMKPRYLIMDEPMSGLDPHGRKSVRQLMRRLQRQNDCTIVMVSHSMEDVAELSDRVLVLNNGEQFALGSPAEVFQRADELLSLGLDVPKSVALTRLLKAKGHEVPDGVFKRKELFEYLKSHLEKKDV